MNAVVGQAFSPARRPRYFRLRAADRACFDSALCEAALRGSFFSAFNRAAERFRDGLDAAHDFPRSRSRLAFFLVAGDVLPGAGGGRSTPARRAFESPMAIACLVERAPCFPLRICSISSR